MIEATTPKSRRTGKIQSVFRAIGLLMIGVGIGLGLSYFLISAARVSRGVLAISGLVAVVVGAGIFDLAKARGGDGTS